MKNVIGAVAVALAFAGPASAEKYQFTCKTSDESSTVFMSVGAQEDGFPLESYKIDNSERVGSKVQYVFQLKENDLIFLLVMVDKTERGRVHHSASIKVADSGIILESVNFNIDSDDVAKTRVESYYSCEFKENEK